MGRSPLSPRGSQSDSSGIPADKPVVHYDRGYDNFYIVVGGHALVRALDPPVHGEDEVTTSRVLEHDPDTGIFETLNTVYKPGEVNEDV